MRFVEPAHEAIGRHLSSHEHTEFGPIDIVIGDESVIATDKAAIETVLI